MFSPCLIAGRLGSLAARSDTQVAMFAWPGTDRLGPCSLADCAVIFRLYDARVLHADQSLDSRPPARTPELTDLEVDAACPSPISAVTNSPHCTPRRPRRTTRWSPRG